MMPSKCLNLLGNKHTMALNTINPTTTSAWQKLQAHYEAIQHTSIKNYLNRIQSDLKNSLFNIHLY